MYLDEFPIISLVVVCDSNKVLLTMKMGANSVTQAGSKFSAVSAKQLKLYMIDATYDQKLGKGHLKLCLREGTSLLLCW